MKSPWNPVKSRDFSCNTNAGLPGRGCFRLTKVWSIVSSSLSSVLLSTSVPPRRGFLGKNLHQKRHGNENVCFTSGLMEKILTGNHRFSKQVWGFPAIFSLSQPIVFFLWWGKNMKSPYFGGNQHPFTSYSRGRVSGFWLIALSQLLQKVFI